MLTSLARAAFYRPSHTQLMPHALSQQSEVWQQTIVPSHLSAYNQAVKWPSSKEQYIHPNYVQVLSLATQLKMMSRSPFPFKALGLVHIANKINVIHLPKRDDTLQLACYFGEMYSHRAGVVFELFSEASVNSVVSVRATSYYLARGGIKHSIEPKIHLNAFSESSLLSSHAKSEAKPSDTSDENASVQLPPHCIDFPENSGREYAKVSGDYNPIHLWPATSRLFGFKRAIAHGMYSHALSLSHLHASQSVDLSQACTISTVFKQAIMLPGQAELSAQRYASKTLRFSLKPAEVQAKPGKIREYLSARIMPL